MTKLELFLNTYKKNLGVCVKNYPDQYSWDISELDDVFNRMKYAISQGTYSKDSSAFRITCNELRIKHTYKAISEYIRSL